MERLIMQAMLLGVLDRRIGSQQWRVTACKLQKRRNIYTEPEEIRAPDFDFQEK